MLTTISNRNSPEFDLQQENIKENFMMSQLYITATQQNIKYVL
jgi:hypothetical protein